MQNQATSQKPEPYRGLLLLAYVGLGLFSLGWGGYVLLKLTLGLVFAGDLELTQAKRAFYHAALISIPVLAFLGFFGGRGWSRFKKGGLVLASAVAALAATSGVLATLYPNYPVEGPNEQIAAAYVFVPLTVTLVVLGWLHRSRAAVWGLVGSGAAVCILVHLATVAAFQNPLEELPLSVDRVVRWQETDIQDYDRYFIRADGVSSEDAYRYAERLEVRPVRGEMGCAPWKRDAPWLSAPKGARVWRSDRRADEADTDRYPSGKSGCFTEVAFADESLYACNICDWGI